MKLATITRREKKTRKFNENKESTKKLVIASDTSLSYRKRENKEVNTKNEKK